MLWMLGRKDAREAAQLNWRSAEIVICWLCLIGSVAGVGWPIDAARAQNAVAARDRLPLGAIYTPQATTFSIWSPDSDDVKVVLDGQALPMARIPDTDQYADVYRATVPGDHHLKRYSFLIRGKTVRDPYGVMAEPATNNNIVMDLSKTEPEGGGPRSQSWPTAKTPSFTNSTCTTTRPTPVQAFLPKSVASSSASWSMALVLTAGPPESITWSTSG